MVERGYRVTAVSSPGEGTSEIVSKGVAVRQIEIRRRISPLRDLRALVALYALCRREKFDIVHTHTSKAGILGRVAAKLSGVPIVLHTFHGTPFSERSGGMKNLLYMILEKLASPFADFYFTQGEEDRLFLIEKGIVKEERVEAIGNGIAIERFENNRRERDRLRQSFRIGREDRGKGRIPRV
jgi:glycosyltransferase involved in cell wall biosynthesis